MGNTTLVNGSGANGLPFVNLHGVEFTRGTMGVNSRRAGFATGADIPSVSCFVECSVGVPGDRYSGPGSGKGVAIEHDRIGPSGGGKRIKNSMVAGILNRLGGEPQEMASRVC